MAVDAIDWLSPPAITDGNDNTTYSMGCRFTVDADIPCAGVRWWVPDSISPTAGGIHRVSLWDSDAGIRRAFRDFTPVPGGNQDVLFVTPFTLLAGVTYVVSVYTKDYTFRAGSFPYSSPGVVGSVAVTDIGKLTASDDPDVLPASNFESVYYVSPLIGEAGDPAEGTVDVGLGLALAATGSADAEGAASLGLDLALAATGSADAEGAAALGLDLALAATGASRAQGQVALALNLALDATGDAPDTGRGTAALGLNLALAATGARDSMGAAGLGLNFAVAAVGSSGPAQGQVALGLNLALAATGSDGEAGCPVPSFPWTPRPVLSFPEGSC